MAQFSCRAPNADYLGFEASSEAITGVAVRAEELGFDAILLNDHLIVDGAPRSAPWANTFDPLITLSYLAARTTRINFMGCRSLSHLLESMALFMREVSPAVRA